MIVNRDIQYDLEKKLEGCADSFEANSCMAEVLNKIGYEAGHIMIAGILKREKHRLSPEVVQRIQKRLFNYTRFEKYKNELFTLVTREARNENLEVWIQQAKASGLSKEEVCDILIELSVYTHHHPATANQDSLREELMGLLSVLSC
jgi:hypothetical protein